MSGDNSKMLTTALATEKRGKASSASADEQLKFLLSCIRYGINGKIDFAEVASECNIVSKGAAAKRYERLLKAHGIQQQAAISPRDASVASTKVKKAATEGKKNPTTKATKKRKAIEAESATNNEEDDEEPSPLAKKSRVKKEIKSEVKVGEEEEGAHDPRLRFDGSFETFVDKHEQGIKNEEGVLVKEEPVDETRGGNTLATEDEEMFDRFLQPGDYDDSIVIGD